MITHIPPAPVTEWYINPQELWRLLNISSLDIEDMQFIEERRERFPSKDRARAEQVVRTHQFNNWIIAPTSTKLLVHSDFGGTQYVSPLSLFCSTLSQHLQRKENFISLVFFCGRHVEKRDGASFGGTAMVKSLIAQLLLCQQHLDTRHIHYEVSLNEVQSGDLNALCSFFICLLRRLPKAVTVFCLIDGIGYYERDETRAGMLQALECVLRATFDKSVPAVVKVLATSVSSTHKVRGYFHKDEILSMVAMARGGGAPSGQRLERHLSGGINHMGHQEHT